MDLQTKNGDMNACTHQICHFYLYPTSVGLDRMRSPFFTRVDEGPWGKGWPQKLHTKCIRLSSSCSFFLDPADMTKENSTWLVKSSLSLPPPLFFYKNVQLFLHSKCNIIALSAFFLCCAYLLKTEQIQHIAPDESYDLTGLGVLLLYSASAFYSLFLLGGITQSSIST